MNDIEKLSWYMCWFSVMLLALLITGCSKPENGYVMHGLNSEDTTVKVITQRDMARTGVIEIYTRNFWEYALYNDAKKTNYGYELNLIERCLSCNTMLHPKGSGVDWNPTY